MQEIVIDNLNDRDKVIRTLADVKLDCYLKLMSGTFNERTPTQSVRGIVRSAKELHSGLIPFISPQRGGVLNPRHESTLQVSDSMLSNSV